MTKFYEKDGDEYKEVEAFSQEDLNKTIASRLERERSKYADYDDLKNKVASVDEMRASYEEKLKEAQQEASEAKSALSSAKLETEKIKIVNEFKLNSDLADFVTGNTAEEMRARAEKLAHNITGGAVEINKVEKPERKESNTETLRKQLFGRNDG